MVVIRVIYTVFDEFITENLPRLTAVDHDDDYVGDDIPCFDLGG